MKDEIKEIIRLNHECDTYLKIAAKRKNIIDELEKYLEEQALYSFPTECGIYRTILNKLKELKGSDK